MKSLEFWLTKSLQRFKFLISFAFFLFGSRDFFQGYTIVMNGCILINEIQCVALPVPGYTLLIILIKLKDFLSISLFLFLLNYIVIHTHNHFISYQNFCYTTFFSLFFCNSWRTYNTTNKRSRFISYMVMMSIDNILCILRCLCKRHTV